MAAKREWGGGGGCGSRGHLIVTLLPAIPGQSEEAESLPITISTCPQLRICGLEHVLQSLLILSRDLMCSCEDLGVLPTRDHLAGGGDTRGVKEFKSRLPKVQTEDQRHRRPPVLAGRAGSQGPSDLLSQSLRAIRFISMVSSRVTHTVACACRTSSPL